MFQQSARISLLAWSPRRGVCRTGRGAEFAAATPRSAADARIAINQPTTGYERLRETEWQLPWLRLHLTVRDLLKIPTTSYAWPAARRALEECAGLRRRMIETGTFN